MKRDEFILKTKALGKEVFSVQDIRKLFPEESNLKMAIKRLVDSDSIVSVAKGMYRHKDQSINSEKLATQIYYPSYLSFESVLSTYGIINQGLYKLTLATTRHSKKIVIDMIEYEYIQLKPSLFFGFNLLNDVYIADPEKAFLDEMYLITLGKRHINLSEWNLHELHPRKIKEYLIQYPVIVKNKVNSLLSL